MPFPTFATTFRRCLRPLARAAVACLAWFASSPNVPAAEGAAEVAVSRPLSPGEALAAFRVDDGLVVELVAAEPLVVDPVAISFDQRGRMYVVEYRDYPSGPPAGQPPLSRVRLLEDRDGDGRMDHAETFADGLSFAQGVLAWGEGVIVTAAPDVLYLADHDGDGRADERRVLLTGFKAGNPQLRTSFPRLGLDGWIYLSNGLSGGEVHRPRPKTGPVGKPDPTIRLERADLRFRPLEGAVEATTGHGQFGNTEDDFGRRFFCSNRNPAMHAVLPLSALRRNPWALVPSGYEDVAPFGAEAKVFPLVEGATTALSHAGTHTAACGVHVFRGTRLGPDYRGNLFVCEPTGSLVTRSILRPHGASFRAERAAPDRDFLASTDPWHRPVSLSDGPDGALYVVDMYREVIEHPQYMPPGLAEKLPLRSGDDRGRIYRIVRKGSSPSPFAPPERLEDLPPLLASPNGWTRDFACRRLSEVFGLPPAAEKGGAKPDGNAPAKDAGKNDGVAQEDPKLASQKRAIVVALRKLLVQQVQAIFKAKQSAARAGDPKVPVAPQSEEAASAAAASILATLFALDSASDEDLRRALSSPSAELRETAARLCSGQETLSPAVRFTLGLQLLDPAPKARLEAILAWSRFPEAEQHADTLLEVALLPDLDVWLMRAVLTASGPHAAELVGKVAADASKQADAPLFRELVSQWAETVGARGETHEVRAALEAAADSPSPSARRAAILLGVSRGLRRTSGPVGKLQIGDLLGDRAKAERLWPTADADEKAYQVWASGTRKLLAESLAQAADGTLPTSQRIGSVALASLLEPAERARAAVGLLQPQQPAELQAACVEMLFKAGGTDQAAPVLAAWKGLSPRAQAVAVDLWLSRSDGVKTLVEALRDGKVAPSVFSLEQRERLLRLKDPQLAPIIVKFLGEGVSADRQAVAAKYLPALAGDGNVERGAEAFRKVCAACHRVRGEGGSVGPDLTDVRNKSKETLLADVLDPNRAVEPRFMSYVVVTTDGRALTGVLSESGERSVVLRRGADQQDVIARDEIDEMQSTGKSLMPEGIENTLTPQQLADVLAFLKHRPAVK